MGSYLFVFARNLIRKVEPPPAFADGVLFGITRYSVPIRVEIGLVAEGTAAGNEQPSGRRAALDRQAKRIGPPCRISRNGIEPKQHAHSASGRSAGARLGFETGQPAEPRRLIGDGVRGAKERRQKRRRKRDRPGLRAQARSPAT